MAEFLDSDAMDANKDTCYDLIANVSHSGEPGILLTASCSRDLVSDEKCSEFDNHFNFY